MARKLDPDTIDDDYARFLVRAVYASGLMLNEASKAIGRNQTYLQQLATKSKKKRLDEVDRKTLEAVLGMPRGSLDPTVFDADSPPELPTQRLGPPTQLPDLGLLTNAIDTAQRIATDLNMLPLDIAKLAVELYRLGFEDAVDRGKLPSQADLKKFTNVIRLATRSMPRRA